jgi:XTP/dITP diphosphohydrolase
MPEAYLEQFERLKKIMDELREQCPWDRKQTIQSLRQMTIEETYELADAVGAENWKDIREELGDLLLHILFYSVIGKEQGHFTLEEMISGICEKLIRRHPHIYADVKVEDDEEVKRNWERIKQDEGKTSVLSGVPVSLPAIVKAMRLQEKAKQVGFEWDTREQVWEKVLEESAELQEAVSDLDDPARVSGNLGQQRVEEEFGDLIFSLVNYSRFLGIDADQAIDRTNRKFIRRFQQMETEAEGMGKRLSALTLDEMNEIWNRVKKEEVR